jgi:hypothetical protein
MSSDIVSSGINVRRTVEQVGRWHWRGTIAYQGTPEAIGDPDAIVPPWILELRGHLGEPAATAMTLARLTRKLDEAEGALHRRQREQSTTRKLRRLGKP